ncbi:ankyrin [Cryphonectria parasitica EP155]|uniref:Ankyrin n=1 Tax=Cryphonectria parasitica (strain ATCC 38755 / EP155) TaxID=660469 RepID=A0A9P4Y430_CRYP1|nr:ankyrin [Cryphonectria parasitica EP155]KAF3765987.1 ankyrin [Cryphonectria parasitica EP155]
MTALAHAALERRRDMIQYLLRERASSDIQDQNGATALHHAVKPGDERDIIYMLLKAGAKVDIQDSRKKTALMLAAELGREEDAHVLLKFGASLDIRDAEGQTAKDIAKERGWEMIVAIMEHPLASQRNLGTEAGGA